MQTDVRTEAAAAVSTDAVLQYLETKPYVFTTVIYFTDHRGRHNRENLATKEGQLHACESASSEATIFEFIQSIPAASSRGHLSGSTARRGLQAKARNSTGSTWHQVHGASSSKDVGVRSYDGRHPALSNVADGLDNMPAFIKRTDLHSIQHLRVMKNAELGHVHEEDKGMPAGDDQQRDQCRTLHESAAWTGSRGSFRASRTGHALNITGNQGGYTTIHRHGFAVVNVCCIGFKDLFCPSRPLHLLKGNVMEQLVRDTTSRHAGAAHLVSMAKDGRTHVFKVVLDAEDATTPNVIVWPPGCYHEINTP
ncbi:hypothetical protein JKP88DRAFT_240908 [Tribonema minus]|uniref:Uncharacterized protein n=1 Tax=Tribonema minus TaxID=303371 RepID=A0A835ZA20_9STRA|nr:hypothetical protein JKP88DRAFT_240908 [Tribonema minus]